VGTSNWCASPTPMGCGASQPVEEEVPAPPQPESKPLSFGKTDSDEVAKINAKIAEKKAAAAAAAAAAPGGAEPDQAAQPFKRKFGQQRAPGESRGHKVKRHVADDSTSMVRPSEMERIRSHARKAANPIVRMVTRRASRGSESRVSTDMSRSFTRRALTRAFTRRGLHGTSHGHLPGAALAETVAKGWIGMMRTGRHQAQPRDPATPGNPGGRKPKTTFFDPYADPPAAAPGAAPAPAEASAVGETSEV